MKGIVLAIALAIIPVIASAQEKPFLTTAPTPDYYAWWLRTEYHPFGTDVRGIPVARIRPGWCKANEFRKDLFPAEEAKSFEGSGLSFALDGFFDGSTTRQTALVGVCETCKGEHGVFPVGFGAAGGQAADRKIRSGNSGRTAVRDGVRGGCLHDRGDALHGVRPRQQVQMEQGTEALRVASA